MPSTLGTAREVIVRSIEDATPAIRIFELEPTDGVPLPDYTAGAHIDVWLPNGLTRSYSLIGPLDDRRHYRIAVARDDQSRGGSAYLHATVQTGMRFAMTGPRNNFKLIEDGAPVVMLAGGIGITPLWCMVQRLTAIGGSWDMHYAARSRTAAPFVQELVALAKQGHGRLSLWWDDEHEGRPLDLVTALSSAAPESHLYCCGPAPMLAAFKAVTAGWPDDRVHTESFKVDVPDDSLPPIGNFTVELARSGVSLDVPEGGTILDACIMNGIEAPYSCYEGLCGTCETPVLGGIPDHRDNLLTDRARASNETIIICRSGSKTPRLVLDL